MVKWVIAIQFWEIAIPDFLYCRLGVRFVPNPANNRYLSNGSFGAEAVIDQFARI
jgi:hypothetical protein